MKWAEFLHADTNLGKPNVNLIIIGWACLKMGESFKIIWDCIISASYKWFDKSSRLIECFLHGDSDWIILGLTRSALCIFDIWVSNAVVLVKNDFILLVPTEIVLELGFSKCFLIKAWLIVERLFPV